MAFLRSITLTQYRNYTYYHSTFQHAIICITGNNGVGKTNLMDAIYHLCLGKSYFTAQNQVMAQEGTEGFRIAGDFSIVEEKAQVAIVWKQAKKEIFWNGVAEEKIANHLGRISAVMIAPDDLSLLNGNSEERRRWMDAMLCQVDKDYLQALLHYQKILLQRNAWLKMSQGAPDYNQLDFYDQQLAETSKILFYQRTKLLQELLPDVQSLFRIISGDAEEISWQYQSDLAEQEMEQLLKKNISQDLYLGRTSKGLHRDELHFSIKNLLVKPFASQGQKKSLLFALKLAQLKFLTKHTPSPPILLLDDVFEKLDAIRLKALLACVQEIHQGQLVLSDTDRHRLASFLGEAVLVDEIQIV